MTEDLKVIVNETNKFLGTNYNMISFDSLSPENLLQVLVDILMKLEASDKFDVKDNDPDDTIKRILDALKRIQFRPKDDSMDPGQFRQNLINGDKKTIYPILRWIFDNQQTAKEAAYLAKYLLPVNLPPEARAMPEISNLWPQYQMAMEGFIEAHKSYTSSLKIGTQTKELKSDIGAIEVEIENVRKRIERTQSRLDKIPQQELFLEAGHSLRIEKERNKELQSQLEEQKQGLQRAAVLQERLQKELNSARMTTQSTSPKHLMESIIEETQVLEFMCQQKLPQELMMKKQEIQVLQEVIDEPNISRDYLMELQSQIDEVNNEVQQLLETRMAQRGNQNDALAPFRQQAAMVARNKDMGVEQLDQVTNELREVENVLQEKQQQLQETVGEVILRGDDLKQYVNTLRAKSSVYKQQRAELASLKAEVADLTQTLENLKTQDPTLQSTLNQNINSLEDENNSSIEASLMSRPDSPIETRGIAELTRLVDGLSRAVAAARERVTPLSQQLRPLREHVAELKDEKDIKKQSYDALNATLSAESTSMLSEISEVEKTIQKFEEKWRDLQMEQERAELLLAKAREEVQDEESDSVNNSTRLSLKDTLAHQIREEEQLSNKLAQEKQSLITSKDNRAKQLEMWADVGKLLQVKAECFKEAKIKGPGGTLSVVKGAETFTLQ